MEVEKENMGNEETIKMVKQKKQLGGIRTMPFILANEICDRFAATGFNANLITYLTVQLNMPLVKASNTLTNFSGVASFMPIVGALVADSFAGRYWTIIIALLIYELGMIIVTISSIMPQFRPQQCPTHGKESAPRAYELKNKVATVHQDGATVSAYFTKLRSLWDEIQSVLPLPQCTCDGCTCDIGKKLVQHQEKERLYEFLMGLDSEFGVIKTQILATTPTPNLAAAYHLVAEDERQRLITEDKKPNVETTAFKAFVPKRHDISSSSLQKTKSYSRPVKREEEETPHCTICDKDGHVKEGCFKKIGYPDWWPGKQKGNKTKPKASCVEGSSSPIPGLTKEQYDMFLKHFEDRSDDEGNKRSVNMAGSPFEELDWCG